MFQNQVCRFFAAQGHCRFGAGCRFLHVRGHASASGREHHGGAPAGHARGGGPRHGSGGRAAGGSQHRRWNDEGDEQQHGEEDAVGGGGRGGGGGSGRARGGRGQRRDALERAWTTLPGTQQVRAWCDGAVAPPLCWTTAPPRPAAGGCNVYEPPRHQLMATLRCVRVAPSVRPRGLRLSCSTYMAAQARRSPGAAQHSTAGSRACLPRQPSPSCLPLGRRIRRASLANRPAMLHCAGLACLCREARTGRGRRPRRHAGVHVGIASCVSCRSTS